MSDSTKIKSTDPGKPSITDEKSDTNVPGDNMGRAYDKSYLFVIIALIVLAPTIWIVASTTSYDHKSDYKMLTLYILTIVLCAIIILRLGAVHWAFKIAVLIPFFVYLAFFLFMAMYIGF